MDASRILPFVLLPLTVGCQTSGLRTWLDALCLVRAAAEAAAGRREAPHLEARFGGILRDGQAAGRMERIVNRMTKGVPHAGLTYRCRMLASRQIDAFSLPGGLIYVTRGYYDRLATDDQLAAILAHEIAHIVGRDHLKPRCHTETETLAREVSADCRAVVYLSRAGYRVNALVEALKLLGLHRAGRWRAVRLQAALSATRAAARPGPIGPPSPGRAGACPRQAVSVQQRLGSSGARTGGQRSDARPLVRQAHPHNLSRTSALLTSH